MSGVRQTKTDEQCGISVELLTAGFWVSDPHGAAQDSRGWWVSTGGSVRSLVCWEFACEQGEECMIIPVIVY